MLLDPREGFLLADSLKHILFTKLNSLKHTYISSLLISDFYTESNVSLRLYNQSHVQHKPVNKNNITYTKSCIQKNTFESDRMLDGEHHDPVHRFEHIEGQKSC